MGDTFWCIKQNSQLLYCCLVILVNPFIGNHFSGAAEARFYHRVCKKRMKVLFFSKSFDCMCTEKCPCSKRKLQRSTVLQPQATFCFPSTTLQSSLQLTAPHRSQLSWCTHEVHSSVSNKTSASNTMQNLGRQWVIWKFHSVALVLSRRFKQLLGPVV